MLFSFIFINLTIYLINSVSASNNAESNSTIPNSHNSVTEKRNVNRCENYFKDTNDTVIIDIKNYCKNRRCIGKCCKNNKVYYQGTCMSIPEMKNLTKTTHPLDYSDFNIYKSKLMETFNKEKVQKSLKNDFTFVFNRKLKNCGTVVPKDKLDQKYHILEDSTLVEEHPNTWELYTAEWKMEDFCFEYLIKGLAKEEIGPFLITRRFNRTPESEQTVERDVTYIYRSAAMLISCFFLILVLIVYMLLKDLRNIGGMVLMAYVATLTVALFIKSFELIAVNNHIIAYYHCKALTLVWYYATISSFVWMNIMSFDLWWSIRGSIYCRPINRRGELNKFKWYALYAWGTPALVAIIVGVIEYCDLSDWPRILKPAFENCFFNTSPWITLFYLQIPIAVLLAGNWIFYLLTAYNIWRVRKEMARFKNEDKIRFGLYLKLSLLMGISWIFDLIEIKIEWINHVTTVYNGLTGLAIFIIHICKRSTILKLCDRFSINNSFVEKMRRKSSTAPTGTGSTMRQSKKSNYSDVDHIAAANGQERIQD